MLSGDLKFPAESVGSAGIITLCQWTMMPDGQKYLYVWCGRWEILTDKQIPVEGFHSTERWQLVAVVSGDAKVLIPGCQVKAWAKSQSPNTRECFVIE